MPLAKTQVDYSLALALAYGKWRTFLALWLLYERTN
jgi:hypothetical protein